MSMSMPTITPEMGTELDQYVKTKHIGQNALTVNAALTKTRSLAERALKNAFEAAQTGKTSITRETHVDDELLVYEFLVKKFSLQIAPKIITWSPDNVRLNPKPIFALPEAAKTVLTSHLEELRKGKWADVEIRIQGQTIKGHKNILAQSPYFESAYYGDFKEKNGSLEFPHSCTFEGFSTVFDFFYGKTPLSKHCLETLDLAQFLQLPLLFSFAKSQIYEQIQLDNFIEVALAQIKFQDKELKIICDWFLRAHPKIEEEMNLSELSTVDLMRVCHVGKIFHPALTKATQPVFKQKLKLDADFVEVCHFVLAKKDFKLRKILEDAVLTNLELRAQLGGKDESCPAQRQAWNEFRAFMDWDIEKPATEIKA